MSEHRFKEGDRVIFARQSSNPHFRNACVIGKATATVEGYGSSCGKEWVKVRWDRNEFDMNQSDGCYEEDHFDLLKEKPMVKFDPTKPVRTRDGRAARIICTDRDHLDGPILALVKRNTPGHEGEEYPVPYYSDGSYIRTGEHSNDLVNIPVKVTKWINVYGNTTGAIIFDTEEAARKACVIAHGGRTIKAEWEE